MVYAVIYRGYVKKGKELEYQNCWKLLATYFTKNRGALGSTLHKTEDDLWVVYSRWPDKKTKEANWSEDLDSSTFPEEIKNAVIGLKSCLDPKEKFPEIGTTVISEI